MNLTHNNHLNWSVNGVPFGRRETHLDKFNFNLGHIEGPAKSWAEELDIALTKLIDTHGSKLTLFYSGGSDSEVVLRRLVALGANVELLNIRFVDSSNSHETNFAEELSTAFGLPMRVISHDLRHSLNEGAYVDYALKYQCSQLAYLTVLMYAYQASYPIIMGGEIYLQKHQRSDGQLHSPSNWYYIYREDEDGCTYRYSKDTGQPIINEIMTYTPELLYSWLTHPIIKAVANNEYPGKITLLSVKRRVYQEQLQLELTARTKFHGYEMLAWTNRAFAKDMQARLPAASVAKWEYENLIKHLEGQST